MTGEMLCNGDRCCVRVCFFQVVRVNSENRRTGRNAVFVRLDREFIRMERNGALGCGIFTGDSAPRRPIKIGRQENLLPPDSTVVLAAD